VTAVDPGWIGIWLLVGALLAILVELGLMAVWSVGMARKSQALSERLMAEQAELRADVERLQASLAETRALWQPYRRLLRWLRHPITIALMQSYVRRRAAAR
jgi:hypothetical protein